MSPLPSKAELFGYSGGFMFICGDWETFEFAYELTISSIDDITTDFSYFNSPN